MMFVRPFPVQAKALLGAPIVFTRRIPTGLAAAQRCGLAVEVRIRPDLHIVALPTENVAVRLTGHFFDGHVSWGQRPCAEFPGVSMDILAADIADILRLFERGFIDPRSWTSSPEALAQL